MSYYIFFEKKLPLKHKSISYGMQLSSNCCEIIRASSGWDIKHGDNGNVKEWIDKIYKGLNELIYYPSDYQKYCDETRLRTIDNTIKWYCRLILYYNDIFVNKKKSRKDVIVYVY